ncbi:hypothetical protein J6590_060049 [Homalodisca vitripennis]|nr:hypothetical protein J6590_060049 [Homalodisca vitripennis]
MIARVVRYGDCRDQVIRSPISWLGVGELKGIIVYLEASVFFMQELAITTYRQLISVSSAFISKCCWGNILDTFKRNIMMMVDFNVPGYDAWSETISLRFTVPIISDMAFRYCTDQRSKDYHRPLKNVPQSCASFFTESAVEGVQLQMYLAGEERSGDLRVWKAGRYPVKSTQQPLLLTYYFAAKPRENTRCRQFCPRQYVRYFIYTAVPDVWITNLRLTTVYSQNIGRLSPTKLRMDKPNLNFINATITPETPLSLRDPLRALHLYKITDPGSINKVGQHRGDPLTSSSPQLRRGLNPTKYRHYSEECKMAMKAYIHFHMTALRDVVCLTDCRHCNIGSPQATVTNSQCLRLHSGPVAPAASAQHCVNIPPQTLTVFVLLLTIQPINTPRPPSLHPGGLPRVPDPKHCIIIVHVTMTNIPLHHSWQPYRLQIRLAKEGRKVDCGSRRPPRSWPQKPAAMNIHEQTTRPTTWCFPATGEAQRVRLIDGYCGSIILGIELELCV